MFLRKRDNSHLYDIINKCINNFKETGKDFSFSGIENIVQKYLDEINGSVLINEYHKKLNDSKIFSESECEKIIYFILTYNQRVVLSYCGNSPDEQKLFLGYEHSDIKKYEGIHPYPNNTSGEIISKLCNPLDDNDKHKVSTYIKKNFNNTLDENIPKDMKNYLKITSLHKIIAFKEKEFRCKIYTKNLVNIFLKCNKFQLTTLSNKELFTFLDQERQPVKKSNRTDGKYPYYGASGESGKINNYIFNEKLLLIGEDGAKWGEGESTSYIIKGKTWVNNHAHVIRVNENKILCEYVKELFNRLDLSYLKQRPNGGKLLLSDLKLIEFPFPSVDEQKKLLKLLSKSASADKSTIIDNFFEIKQ